MLSKFFLNLSNLRTQGTSRYLQNISGFIGSVERRMNAGINPKDFRPDAVEFNLDKSKRYKFNKIAFDLLYLVDATGSMTPSINEVKDYCVEISNILNIKMKEFDFKFAAVFYRDPRAQNDKNNENEIIDFTDDTESLKNLISKIKAKGGGGDGRTKAR